MIIKELLYYVRIKQINFTDFRNIESGSVTFPNTKPSDFFEGSSSILGLYGQNGSGKTSVIMALGILKEILSGKSIGSKYSSCIRAGCEKCSLSFTFSMFSRFFGDNRVVVSRDCSPLIEVFYDFDISKQIIKSTNDYGITEEYEKLYIENEVIKIKTTDQNGNITLPKQVFFDTRKAYSDDKGRAFGSETKYYIFTLGDKKTSDQYKMAKAIAKENGTSFLFSPKFINIITGISNALGEFEDISNLVAKFNSLAIKEEDSLKDAVISIAEEQPEDLAALTFFSVPYIIIKSLRTFGLSYLHIVDTATTGETNINTNLPLLLWRSSHGKGASFCKLSLSMDRPTSVPEHLFDWAMRAIKSISNVLNKIVPDLLLEVVDLGKQLSKDNKEEHCFEIMSKRNDTIIPLKYESDGIRRMVSIMSLLIAVYNEESFTVAIDELDSGIFEYLLGELLLLMTDSIKGQFIFTSHNLRPLEVLPAKYLCFTTTNPKKRFTVMTRRGNSNLRDTYYRSIVLGTNSDSVYDSTNRYDIEHAFYLAGHIGGTES